MTKMSTVRLQIAERARKHKGEALFSLHQFITEELLMESYKTLNKKSSTGVDGENWYEYGINAQERIPELMRRFKTGEYKAPPIRRAYIPKGEIIEHAKKCDPFLHNLIYFFPIQSG